jgi:hypothetical protein
MGHAARKRRWVGASLDPPYGSLSPICERLLVNAARGSVRVGGVGLRLRGDYIVARHGIANTVLSLSKDG